MVKRIAAGFCSTIVMLGEISLFLLNLLKEAEGRLTPSLNNSTESFIQMASRPIFGCPMVSDSLAFYLQNKFIVLGLIRFSGLFVWTGCFY